MKIALAQINFTIADIQGNSSKIIAAIKKAKAEAADLVVFSELSVCAYPPDDLLDYPHFIRDCEKAVHEIATHCTGISAIIGAPMVNPSETGRRLYNTACLLSDGRLQEIVGKTLLPTYDVFNESRYFETNDIFKTVQIAGVSCALSICEDLWHETDHFKYRKNPLKELFPEQPQLVINLSASPFNRRKKTERYRVLQEQASTFGLPIVYVNQCGAHSDLIFDGNSMVLNGRGEIVLEMPAFEENLAIWDSEMVYPALSFTESDDTEALYRALVFGIRDYFAKSGFSSALLGSSGGIDSAVVQALASEALGAGKVRAVLMPSPFSSEGSVEDARQLSQNLGNEWHILPIEAPFKAFEDTLKPLFGDLPFDVAEENIQARSRAVLLMAISNKFGDILLNTSNKSEMSVGYTTLYGDMCGSLSVMGDVYKTDVYRLAHYINREKEIIPSGIILKAPSAELRPGQKDSDSLPDYELLDAILSLYIDEQKGTEDIINASFDPALVRRIITMVNRNEYKRFQAPPILRVSKKAYGRGRIIPLVSRW